MSADAAHPDPDVARRLAKIYTLHKSDIDLRLDESPYIRLLKKLGDPHKKLAPVVHVAGTNGKGSVLAFLRAMLEADGKRVHVYTSPHLLTFNERIRINGQIISDQYLTDLYDRVEAGNANAPITFFEFTTAMAFLAFAENETDYVLLETGLGGRLDCTNVIEKPIATAITKISYDHMEFLGYTLEQIAGEKAGIMKPGVPCVIGDQLYPHVVMPVFINHAEKIGVDLIHAHFPSDYPKPNLEGTHQIENAATALTLAGLLKISDAGKRDGITHAQWPGRLQRISANPEIWFDAAHNDSGALALAAQLRTWKTKNPDQPIHLVVGLAADKDPKTFFDPMAGLYDTLTLVDLPQARKPQTASELHTRAGIATAQREPDINQALEKLRKNSGLIMVSGSLYLYQQLHASQKSNNITKK